MSLPTTTHCANRLVELASNLTQLVLPNDPLVTKHSLTLVRLRNTFDAVLDLFTHLNASAAKVIHNHITTNPRGNPHIQLLEQDPPLNSTADNIRSWNNTIMLHCFPTLTKAATSTALSSTWIQNQYSTTTMHLALLEQIGCLAIIMSSTHHSAFVQHWQTTTKEKVLFHLSNIAHWLLLVCSALTIHPTEIFPANNYNKDPIPRSINLPTRTRSKHAHILTWPNEIFSSVLSFFASPYIHRWSDVHSNPTLRNPRERKTAHTALLRGWRSIAALKASCKTLTTAIEHSSFPYPYYDTRERLICEQMWQSWYTICECRQLPTIEAHQTSSTTTTLPTEHDKPPPYILHRWVKERLKYHHVILRPIPNSYVPALPKDHPNLYYKLNPAAQPLTPLELKEKALWYVSTIKINSRLHMPSEPLRTNFYIPSALVANIQEEMARQQIPPFDFDYHSFNANPRDPNSILRTYITPRDHDPWRSFDDLITEQLYDRYPCYKDLTSADIQMNNTKHTTRNTDCDSEPVHPDPEVLDDSEPVHPELEIMDEAIEYYYSHIAPSRKRARSPSANNNNSQKRTQYEHTNNTSTAHNNRVDFHQNLPAERENPSSLDNDITQY